MTYNQLAEIAKPYIDTNANIPCNSLLIATNLKISFKMYKQYELENGSSDLLYRTPAFLKYESDKPTVYYNEKSSYWNFYIFHEIAHYLLGHKTDGIEEERDANMLACILTAPIENLPSYLKSARDLSCLCHIPIDKAEEYWNDIYMEVHRNYVSDVVNDYLLDVHTTVDRLLSRIDCMLQSKSF